MSKVWILLLQAVALLLTVFVVAMMTLYTTGCHGLDATRPAILLVDAFRTSHVVELAVKANLGQIRREVTVTHQGSPIIGARDLRGYFSCPGVILAHVVVSRDEARVVTWNKISEGEVVRFQEGQFPMDSTLVLCVGTVWGVWLQLYSGNIQRFISETRDLYVRGSESRSGKGLAYVSDRYDAIGHSCKEGIPHGVLNATVWSERTLHRREYPPPHYLRPDTGCVTSL